MARERPILFTGPMVRAILAGQKTQTRRPVKPQPIAQHHVRWLSSHGALGSPGFYVLTNHASVVGGIRCPYGEPGDRLWVRETFVAGTMNGGERPWVRHRATDERDVPPGTRWKPAIHMPRWACRLVLEVTAVRVERVQTITEGDASAEGMLDVSSAQDGGSLRTTFLRRWDAMYGGADFACARNPWVWVVEFRRVEAAKEAA